MDTALVLGAATAGLLVGGALDPVGQRVAGRSRADAEHRRAETTGPKPSTPGPSRPPSGRHSEPTGRALPDLVPAGPSRTRTVGAAVGTSVLFAAVAVRFGPDAVVAPFCALVALLVVVTVTDLSHRLVPRRLVYPGLALIASLLVVTAAVDDSWPRLVGAAVGGAATFCALFAIWWLAPGGLGFGDVRLGGVIGLSVGYLSLLHAYVAVLAGFVIGALFGLVVMGTATTGRIAPEGTGSRDGVAAGGGTAKGRRTRIPFAPALAAGALVAVLWGGPLSRGVFGAR